MSDEFLRSLKFGLPISLICWALFVWLILSTFNGCSQVTITPNAPAVVTPPAPTKIVTPILLEWTTPAHNTDGSVADIEGYKIYFGPTSDYLLQTIRIHGADMRSIEIEHLPLGVWHFEITAIGTDGNESARSNMVSKVAT